MKFFKSILHYAKNIIKIAFLNKEAIIKISQKKSLNTASILLFLISIFLFSLRNGYDIWITILLFLSSTLLALTTLYITHHLTCYLFSRKQKFLPLFRAVGFSFISVVSAALITGVVSSPILLLLKSQSSLAFEIGLNISLFTGAAWALAIASKVIKEVYQVHIISAIFMVFLSGFISSKISGVLSWLIVTLKY